MTIEHSDLINKLYCCIGVDGYQVPNSNCNSFD